MDYPIFINYRRDDEAGTAGRLYDHLIHRADIPRDNLFKDVDNIIPGTNFVDVLTYEVSRCELMISVIGRRWAEALDSSGNRRLDDPNDFVRIEIEAALQRGIPVIPLLIDGTPVPAAHTLPDSLKPLCQQHGVEVRNSNFEADVDRLVKAIEYHRNLKATEVPPTQPPPPPQQLEQEKIADSISNEPPASNRIQKDAKVTKADLKVLGGMFYMAEAGDSQYLYEVATRLEKGHGVPRNLSLATKYYQKAASAGYGKAHAGIERIREGKAKGSHKPNPPTRKKSSKPTRPKVVTSEQNCPRGHGPLKLWDGLPRCWKCGWPDK